MNKEKFVSIIIPIYNGEVYIDKCVSSIKHQTYKNFEVLLIDDGSKDATASLCDQIAIEDKKFRVIHKTNGGVSSARNLGISNALYEYITFVDVDDYIEPQYIENLVKVDADVVIGGAKIMPPQNEIIRYEAGVYDRMNIGKNISDNIFTIPFFTPWAKLYKTEILKDFNIKFDEKIIFSEDTIFFFEYLAKCESFVFISATDYCHYLSDIFKYKMSNDDIVYRANRLIDSFSKMSMHCAVTDISYETVMLHGILMSIINNEKVFKFSLRGYAQFKNTIKSLPNLQKYYPNSKKPNILFKLLREGFYRLAFFLIRFILPLIKK
ncbi:glycosyltransferase family 2 protein [Bacteroides sp.]|uniref:glycosyltransferase family 2 protein n=1 Tax=Bacteroides sp. TaxID=29523 RepID=UPI0025BFC7BE|nr:glycosyltransferase family 2 protein [Bacteroides sp.]